LEEIEMRKIVAGLFLSLDGVMESPEKWNTLRKFVVSTTLDTADWQNSSLIRGDVVQELTRLKQQPGKSIGISGSATLVRSLLRDNLLDELNLLVPPIVVGSGRRLFEDMGGQLPLQLVDSKTFSNGVLSLRFAPAGK
jgi:dihydrofolate reductase